MPHSLRLPEESDDEFRSRALRASRIARVLVEACLANGCTQDYLADPALPFFTEQSVRTGPIARIEYEQAIAIGDLFGTLHMTRGKRWGAGPQVLPLHVDDCFFPAHITYIYRENSLYNRRYEQRMQMRELLAKPHRDLVGRAKMREKRHFLRTLTAAEREAIWRTFYVDPGLFWQAAQGRAFLDLPQPPRQLLLDFGDE